MAKNAVKHCVLRFRSYQWLAHAALTSQKPLHKFTPKFHSFARMFKSIIHSYRNPRFEHCYMDEEFMGKVRNMSAKVHPLTLPLRTAQHYILYLSRWLRGESVKTT